MIVLSNSDIKQLLTMEAAIGVVQQAMISVSAGETKLPLRNVLPVDDKNNKLGIMPGVMASPACYGVKLISLYPENPKIGKSSHQGAMVLFDLEDGAPIAFMDASLLTAVRTAAASAVATRLLAPGDAKILTLIGCGEQAEHHLEAMLVVRPIEEVRIVGRDLEKAAAFAHEIGEKFPDLVVTSGIDAKQMIIGSDIICTVTSAAKPVLFADWVIGPVHINCVGASVATVQEIDAALISKSSVIVDYLPSTLAQAADVIEALEAGLINKEEDLVEIGDLLGKSDRPKVKDITLYRSLGVAAQDIATAHYLLAQAVEKNIGQQVDLQ